MTFERSVNSEGGPKAINSEQRLFYQLLQGVSGHAILREGPVGEANFSFAVLLDKHSNGSASVNSR